MNIYKYKTPDDGNIPVKRLQLRPSSTGSILTEVQITRPFLKGPIPMEWLCEVAMLPGKALNVALAIHWLYGMNGSKPVKLTAKALKFLSVSEDACSDGLKRLENAGLITVIRQPGQRPIVDIRQLAPTQ